MWRTAIVLMCAVLAGCAAGNRYNYRDHAVSLPIRAEGQRILVLTVEDLRPYVLNGDKPANFVGLQRGGFGNPFDVTTASGQSLTQDMKASISNSLRNAGYTVIANPTEPDMSQLKQVAAQNDASRIVWLKVKDWKSDIFVSIGLSYDLHLAVYDAQGNLLAENTQQGDSTVGGGKLSASQNSEHMAQEFSKRIGYLFNSPSIRDAL
ncbi:MAG: hypothetical protein KDJ27_05485 [Gammaproteobacteria bacterium]|nr:hypothetical protein [Gammaproteobacteria bacterium]